MTTTFERGDRVRLLAMHPESSGARMGAPPGAVGQIVGEGGVLDCCLDPENCYAVLIVNDTGNAFMVCARGEHLQLLNDLN